MSGVSSFQLETVVRPAGRSGLEMLTRGSHAIDRPICTFCSGKKCKLLNESVAFASCPSFYQNSGESGFTSRVWVLGSLSLLQTVELYCEDLNNIKINRGFKLLA